MKIVVVDDEGFGLKLLTRQLTNLGYADVLAYQDPHAALAVIASPGETIGLVFLDLQMPEMDGVEFVRHLVRLRYTGALVLVSGEDERIIRAVETLARAHQLDMIGSLSKPVTPELLQQVLQSNLFASSPRHARAAPRQYPPEEVLRGIDGGELVNFYQPKVCLTSGRVVGVEALVRWEHPQHGLVTPDQFIGVAEEHGLIDRLTGRVLHCAVLQARTWQDAGLDLQVAVNVSMDNLRALDFPEFVIQQAATAGIEPSRLMLEITESRLMSDARAPLDILTRLRLKRIGLSIDDFGTGHSSLAQLRDLPFGELKVDRGFVHGASTDAARRAILEASLRMARRLGMKVVAEGVEDRTDWDLLRANDCDVAQGYFIARPMAPGRIGDWLTEWERRVPDLLGPVT